MNTKTVLITGASSGIGEGCARIFARNGHRVILNGRNLERLMAVKTSLEADYGAQAYLLPFDVRDRAAASAALDSLPPEWKDIDVLVNNAGFGISGAAEFTASQDAHRLMEVNLFGMVNLTTAVLPHMRRAGRKMPPGPHWAKIFFFICAMAFFSRRETWAWEMWISSATSIWVLPS